MTPQSYISDKLTGLNSTNGSLPRVSEPLLVDVMIELATSKKYRKYAISPELLEHIHASVTHSVRHNQPINLILLFGGYKLWRLEQYPYPDWAELFSLIYYTRWLKPICEIYEPGVVLDFFSDDVVVSELNNIPQEATEAYIHAFRQLIEFVKPYQPPNLHMTLTRAKDQYASIQDFKQKLDGNIQYLQAHPDQVPPITHTLKKRMVLNIKPSQGNAVLDNQYERSHLVYCAYQMLPELQQYIREARKIRISPLTAHSTIAVGTTKSSIVKFWVGIGALLPTRKDYNQVIVSPSHVNIWHFQDEPIDIGFNHPAFRSVPVLIAKE